MRLISPLLKNVIYPLLSTSGYFRRMAGRGGLSVVTYHGVLPEGYKSPDSFLDGNLISGQLLRRQLRCLKANYQVVSPDDVLAWLKHGEKLPPRAVLLTCDDGLLNNLTDMVPILREEGLSCLFFVTGLSARDLPRMLWYEELYWILKSAAGRYLSFETLGIQAQLGSLAQRRVLWWELVRTLSRLSAEQRDCFLASAQQQLGSVRHDWSTCGPGVSRRFFVLTRRQLQELAANGMSVGAHSVSHPVLAQNCASDALREMQNSRQLLESVLGKNVWALAYPFGGPGSVIPRDIELAERAGFECGFLNCGGGFGSSLLRFALPRIHISSGMKVSEVDAHVSGFYRVMRGSSASSALLTVPETGVPTWASQWQAPVRDVHSRYDAAEYDTSYVR
jgi:peptidoglycan/xylan/chitin deacetylase (PgdA/CDA1 family)